MRSSISPLRPLALVAVLLLLVAGWRLALPGDDVGGTRTAPPAAGGAWPPGGSAPPAGEGAMRKERVRLDARACFDAGYLCQGLQAESEPRVLRWGDDVSQIVVHVGLPEDADRGRARALQRAAAAGIREWQGNPLPLRIDLGRIAPDTDVRVTWTRQLTGRELGRVSSRWIRGSEGWRVEIGEFALSTHSPTSSRELSPAQVELTAAHEMGHVLGLPHSDDPRDVMFPLNTSVRLTSRDFRTLGALYRLPVGALVEVGGEGR